MTEPKKQQKQPVLPIREATKTVSKRYYYANESSLFEQSLDVYKPSLPAVQKHDSTQTSVAPAQRPMVVVLVVGSGWLGHRSFLYSVFAWWNSSGPKTFARLGYTCVCIRHRGSFPVLFPLGLIWGYPRMTTCGASGLLVALAIALAFVRQQDNLEGLRVALLTVALTIVGLATVLLLLTWLAKGRATFDDMLDDVANALVWVHNHPEELLLMNENDSKSTSSASSDGSSATNPQTASTTAPKPFLVFGGYSSGGHVAASLLQRPDLLRQKGLPLPNDGLCDAVCLLSGVLATRPLPSSLADSDYVKRKHYWFARVLLQVVFGPSEEAVRTVPSPLHKLVGDDEQGQTSSNESSSQRPASTKELYPTVPHVLICCQREVPIPLRVIQLWTNPLFCSSSYSQVLTEKGVPTKLVQLPATDHWRILNSTVFSKAVSNEMVPFLRSQIELKKKDGQK